MCKFFIRRNFKKVDSFLDHRTRKMVKIKKKLRIKYLPSRADYLYFEVLYSYVMIGALLQLEKMIMREEKQKI